MGNFIKEKYICPVSCIKRSTSTDFVENYYWVSSGLCPESNRLNSRFYSSYRLPGRLVAVTIWGLPGYTVNSVARLEGVSGLGGGAYIGYTSQPSSCNRNRHYLGFGYSWTYVLVMAICRRCKKHLTVASKSFAIDHWDAQNARALYARR